MGFIRQLYQMEKKVLNLEKLVIKASQTITKNNKQFGNNVGADF